MSSCECILFSSFFVKKKFNLLEMLLNEMLFCASQRSLLYSKTNIWLDMNIVYLGHVIACQGLEQFLRRHGAPCYLCATFCPHAACAAAVVFLCHQAFTRLKHCIAQVQRSTASQFICNMFCSCWLCFCGISCAFVVFFVLLWCFCAFVIFLCFCSIG